MNYRTPKQDMALSFMCHYWVKGGKFIVIHNFGATAAE